MEIKKGIYISESSNVLICEENGKCCVYAGDDARKVGEFDSVQEATASAMDYVPVRPMTDVEIKAELAKRGGYDAYRQDTLGLPKPLKKSASQIFMEGCEVVAKHRGQTLAEFFKLNAGDYERYVALVNSRG